MNVDALREQMPFFKAGRAKGREEGREEGLRVALGYLCGLLGIELTEERRAHLASLHATELEQLRLHLEQRRAWPE